jgi:hypothetical protein
MSDIDLCKFRALSSLLALQDKFMKKNKDDIAEHDKTIKKCK